MPRFEATEAFAASLDAADALAPLRDEFIFPERRPGEPSIYLAGHSLGLQPRKTSDYVRQELDDWGRFGVEGHHRARNPWVPYHELAAASLSRIVGALPCEVVVMNTLTVNLHFMMMSFYRPRIGREKILIEAGAFSSDRYAVASQLRFHGLDPASTLIEVAPRPGEDCIRPEDLLARIEREGPRLALVLLGNVNYLTGQAFDMPAIVKAGHAAGARVGFDLAHGAGNLALQLHDWDVDFAVWCGYKYLNAGPGCGAGCFVHQRHARLPRLEGWWGHDKKSRFQMPPAFEPIPGAEAWQLSNPPILPLAALRASLELFDLATMPALRRKSEQLTGYLEFLLARLPKGHCRILTPRDAKQRGCQLSLRMREDKDKLLARLRASGVVCDFREPDVLRAAPAPLYTRFTDVFRFAAALAPHGTPTVAG